MTGKYTEKEHRHGQEIIQLLNILIKTRVTVDFNFYKGMKDLEEFPAVNSSGVGLSIIMCLFYEGNCIVFRMLIKLKLN